MDIIRALDAEKVPHMVPTSSVHGAPCGVKPPLHGEKGSQDDCSRHLTSRLGLPEVETSHVVKPMVNHTPIYQKTGHVRV
jgi:hypothetical protein